MKSYFGASLFLLLGISANEIQNRLFLIWPGIDFFQCVLKCRVEMNAKKPITLFWICTKILFLKGKMFQAAPRVPIHGEVIFQSKKGTSDGRRMKLWKIAKPKSHSASFVLVVNSLLCKACSFENVDLKVRPSML